MALVLLDTSVYIEALRDEELESKIKEAAKKAVMISSTVVEKEIEDASSFLRRRGDKDDAERLQELYRISAGGVIGLKPIVLKLSVKYADKVKDKFGKDKAKKMRDDFRIVAGASAGSVGEIGTLNRKTMANEEIVRMYQEVNTKHGFKTPRFIKTRSDLIKLLSSL